LPVLVAVVVSTLAVDVVVVSFDAVSAPSLLQATTPKASPAIIAPLKNCFFIALHFCFTLELQK
jgi:hypothetical protein